MTNGRSSSGFQLFRSLQFLIPPMTSSKQFSLQRSKASTTEEESAKYLVSSVQDYVTPASDIVALTEQDTANVAIASMKQQKVRHLVVADKVKEGRLLNDSKVSGVISS